jgi:hypothetical protein
MAKEPKSAVELANMIRSRLSEPKMRLAVFANPNGGWRAMVYVDSGSVRAMQRRVGEAALELNGMYASVTITAKGLHRCRIR